MEETYKDIIGYEGLYQISNLGNVKSLARVWVSGKTYDCHRSKPETILKPSIDGAGYAFVGLNRKSIMVHHLVWDAFGSELRNGRKTPIDHIDNNKLNNCIDNLQILTQRQNAVKYNKEVKKDFNYGVRKHSNRFIAQISVSNKKVIIGSYTTEQEAKDAYCQKLAGLGERSYV